jgi:hypothetical protein
MEPQRNPEPADLVLVLEVRPALQSPLMIFSLSPPLRSREIGSVTEDGFRITGMKAVKPIKRAIPLPTIVPRPWKRDRRYPKNRIGEPCCQARIRSDRPPIRLSIGSLGLSLSLANIMTKSRYRTKWGFYAFYLTLSIDLTMDPSNHGTDLGRSLIKVTLLIG